ncbi:MAG: hypothetical protein BWY31_03952 [Lentisphaerae bacterium ADurb.Bin242]|nr:MAG: hypothetical protein BWY31_03952 [Lentisphaerae bacterium ADurb.Bin242]
MFCAKCGQELAEESLFCSKCGKSVNAPVVILRDGFDVFIPRNVLALWSYYLGIFSLLCGITSLPAIVTGIMGLNYAKKHPEAKGVVHCWVGIIVSIFSLLLMAFFIFLLAKNC